VLVLVAVDVTTVTPDGIGFDIAAGARVSSLVPVATGGGVPVTRTVWVVSGHG